LKVLLINVGYDMGEETLTSKDSVEHPICGSKRPQEAYTKAGYFTFESTIMVLSENPVLHISRGPPDIAGYEMITFSQ
jgi:hypothetical protein